MQIMRVFIKKHFIYDLTEENMISGWEEFPVAFETAAHTGSSFP